LLIRSRYCWWIQWLLYAALHRQCKASPSARRVSVTDLICYNVDVKIVAILYTKYFTLFTIQYLM
jgi:hypothetical protein